MRIFFLLSASALFILSISIQAEAKCSFDSDGNVMEPCGPPGIVQEKNDPIRYPFAFHDLVLVGNVVSSTQRLSENQTIYYIDVEKYLKNPKPYDMITAIGDGTNKTKEYFNFIDFFNQPVFGEGDKVFLYLTNDDGIYRISPYSFAISKNNCCKSSNDIIIEPFASAYNPNETITMSGEVRKARLYEEMEKNEDAIVKIQVRNSKDDLVKDTFAYIKPDGTFSHKLIIRDQVGDYSADAIFGVTTISDVIRIRENIGCCSIGQPLNLIQEPNWKILRATGKYLNSDPPKPDEIFNIKYRAINGVIESFEQTGNDSFLAQVNSEDNGILEILFPRNYPYTNGDGEDHGESFMVFNHEGLPKSYEVKLEKTDCFFEYSIPYTGNQSLELAFTSILIATPFHGDKILTDCIDETIYLLPPTKQFKSGIAADDIKCKENYQKIFKIKNGYPACVKSENVIKLIMWGWARNIFLSNPCLEDYPNGLDIFQQPFSLTSPKGLVFFMEENSTAKICVRYTSPFDNLGMDQVYSEMWTRKPDYKVAPGSEITVNANPSFLPLNRDTNVTVTYTITAQNNSKGVYWLNISQICDLIPVIVGIDSSELSSDDIPVFLGFHSCPAESLNAKIIGVSDAKVDYKMRQPIGEP